MGRGTNDEDVKTQAGMSVPKLIMMEIHHSDNSYIGLMRKCTTETRNEIESVFEYTNMNAISGNKYR